VLITFQFAAILSPIHDRKMNIFFLNAKVYSSALSSQDVLCWGGGLNLLPNAKAKSSLQQLSQIVREEGGWGGLAKELEPDYEPERGTYFGKGLLVERRLAIDDDLRIGNYIA
jgi:hypothetical protein